MRKTVFLTLMLLIAVPLFALETPAPPPAPDAQGISDARAPRAETPTPPRRTVGATQLFHVVLLIASTDGPERTEGLPKQAEKAIADIRDFLPYKSYQLLDSGLVRATANSMSSQIVLRGSDDETEYVATVRFSTKPDQSKGLLVEQFVLLRDRGPKAPPLGPGVAPQAPRKMIDSSFSIDVGETVVVGSSKLNGRGRALVVLLTAMPKS